AGGEGMIRLVLVVTLLLGSAVAQEGPVATAARKQIMERAHHLLDAAKEMPAEKYEFKASEKQMTFGHMVFHTARANFALCSLVVGERSQFPQDLKDTDAKDKLVPVLEQSVTYCDGVLAKVSDKNLGETLKTPWGAEMTRAELLLEINADQADHYSLAATYLRLNGLLPPTAKK
ncbi:MAG TPA: DinB family protein, partial [Terriglobales bacterium]|nr:DinB family protein [Terriglobales bacterium]